MSLKALLVSILIIVSLHFIYYPKWKEIRTEATLSWDVSGYYMYLPAAFIYKDLKKCRFKDDILEKYKDSLVHSNSMRIQRHMNDNGVKRIFMDIRKPTQKISAIEVSFWNGEGQKEIILNDIIVETFDEE